LLEQARPQQERLLAALPVLPEQEQPQQERPLAAQSIVL